MARYVPGPLISDLRGSLGRVVFDSYKGVKIVRLKPTTITNPQSYHQMQIRNALGVYTTAWRALTLTQQQLWNQIIREYPAGAESDSKINRCGIISTPRGPFSGWNAFLACNMNRFLSGYSLITDVLQDAPIGKEKPEGLSSFLAVGSPGTITVTWSYIVPGPQPERIEIWIKSVDAGIHPQMVYTADVSGAGGSVDITAVRGVSGIYLNLPPGNYQLQAQIVNQYGLVSPPSQVYTTRVEGGDMFTYFTARQNVLSLASIGATVPWTEIDLSGIIPAGAHSAILLIEILCTTHGPGYPNYIELRKDAAQGRSVLQDLISSDTGEDGETLLMQITTARKIEYAITITGAAPDWDVNIYVLGYVK